MKETMDLTQFVPRIWRSQDERREWIDAFYQAHIQSAMGFAYVLTGETAEAEDLVHEAFVRVLSRMNSGGSVEQPEAYLRASILNVYRSRWRRIIRERRLISLVAGGTHTHIPPTATYEDKDTLWQGIARLPPRQRAAIFLRYYESRSYADIAGILGNCSESAVKSLLAHALESLRTYMR
jgi:RNA polymerase sigma factor (sigma-70 family)